MLSKSLIIVLLGCILALANPVQINEPLASQSGSATDIGSWLQESHYRIRKVFTKTLRPFVKTYDTLIEAGYIPEYNKDKIEYLRIIFHEITDRSWEQLVDIENRVYTNTIIHLQNTIEYLSGRPSGTGIEQGTNQNVQHGQHVTNKENQNVQEFISNPANNAKDQFNQMPNSAWSSINSAKQSLNNMGYRLQSAINGQMENVKENLNGGFKLENVKKTSSTAVDSGVNNFKGTLNQWSNNYPSKFTVGEGIINKFGSEARGALNNGMNTIGSGIENVKKNLSQWGNRGFGLTQGIDKFGNHAQESFSNGLHGVQNQLNQFAPSINKHEGNGNMYGSKKLLNWIGQELARPIATTMNELEQNLLQWKNITDNFLVNEKIKIVQQPQPQPNMNGGIANIQGSTSFMPNNNKKIVAPKKATKGNGIFSKIGQKVGRDFGGGVDKFADTIGSFFNNAGKLFG